MAEPGPGVKGWDTAQLLGDRLHTGPGPARSSPARDLQELITESLSSDCAGHRPELGQGIFLEGLPSWDFGVY